MDAPTATALEQIEVGHAKDVSSDDFASLLRTIRRHLHQHPEVGFEEVETSRFIAALLTDAGLTVRGPIARTGLYVDIEGTQPGPTIAYRADIDALPAYDRKNVSYASKNDGAAHLCGHDAHTTVAIGTAIQLHKMRDQIRGTIRVFFQPNEEGVPSGAPEMIRDGVLEGVDAAYAIHVDPTLPVGKFGLIRGAATAAADRFEVVVAGPSSGHSARPHQTIDTVWVSTLIAQNLYQLVGRVNDSRNAAVLTICRFQGGSAFNVIPRRVEFGGTLRCTDHSDRKLLKQKIINVAQQIGSLHHARIDVHYHDGAPPVINDVALVDDIIDVASDLFGKESVVEIPVPSMGAEDFAYYLESVPGVLIRVGTSSSPETSYPLHDSLFDIDERSLAPAVNLVSELLIARLSAGTP